MLKISKKKIDWVKSILIIIAVSIFLPLFVYTNNAEEARFIDVLPIMIIFAVGSILIEGLFYIFTRKVYLSAIASILLTLIFCNYALIEKLVSRIFPLQIWHILPILIVITLHIIYFMNKKINIDIPSLVLDIFGIVFGVLILFNTIIAIPKIITKMSVETKQTTDIFMSMTGNTENMPNVYYLLYDEYSNFDMIEKYYDYDNYHFAEFLEEREFAVSYDTVNESSLTNIVVTNYMNYDYVVDDNSPVELRTELRENNEMIKLFSKYGYEMIGVGKSSALGIKSATKDYDDRGATTIEGFSLQKMILQQTVIGTFLVDNDSTNRKAVLDAFAWFENKENLSGTGKFIAKYIVSPHQPFIFDENGNPVQGMEQHNWEDKSYYLGQYIFITKNIQEIIDNIILNDPNSIIILQSDHAHRGLKGTEIIDKRKPINAVYYRGDDISEIKGQSGVNTWRLILNRLFDMKLDILEVPGLEVND